MSTEEGTRHTPTDVSNNLLEMPTLGRPLRIGMLYDRRNDTFIPGVTLWDLEELQTNLDIQPQLNTSFSIIYSDSIEAKSSSLGVEASLKASFLAGLVEVIGSAKYLNDTKTSKQQARLTLSYRATTSFKQLTMSQLGPQQISYPSVFDQDSATHVVTAVLYGAHAFFVFDQQCSSSDNKQDVEGRLEVMVRKIPTSNIEGKAVVELSDAEKKEVEKFNCTFHGDVFLKRNPVNYQDALEIYSRLPMYLGKDGEYAVPLRVWLYPLRLLDSKAARIVREISIGLVTQCQLISDQFRDLEMSCNDLISKTATRQFPQLKRKVQSFNQMCLEHQTVFQKGLAEILPSIRGAGHEESGLADMLLRKARSPFSNSALTTWLEKKEKETNIVGEYLALLEGVDVLTKSQLDTVLADPMSEDLVCFTFTSLGDPDAYLQELSSYLQTPRSLPEPGDTSPPEADWFEVESVIQQMRQRVRLFLQFSESNRSYRETKGGKSCQIVISSVDDKSHPGAANFLYQQGILVNKEFQLQKPDIPLISGTTDCSVTLHLKAPADKIEQVLMFWVWHRCGEDQSWFWENTQDDSESFTVSGLLPHRTYQFRFAPVYKSWVGLLSEPKSAVLTLPAAPPGEVSVSNLQPTSLTIAWAPPALLGDGVIIGHYIVKYQRDNSQEGTWTELRTESQTCQSTLGNLRPDAGYRIQVSADCGGAGVGAPSQELVVITPRDRSPALLAESLCRTSKLVKDGRPAVYQLPLREEEASKGKWGKYVFGAAGSSGDRRKIIVVGDKETERSDLINGLANYILGVDWADLFRFQLTAGSAGHSLVTQYEINHLEGCRIPYSLTIVDINNASVFWKTQDTQRRIYENCNFVCAVSQSPAVSLPKEVKLCLTNRRIRELGMTPQLLVTSCDHQAPAVPRALLDSGIDFPKEGEGVPTHFKFNFSGLFAAHSGPDHTGEGVGEGSGPGGPDPTAGGRAGADGWNANMNRLFWEVSAASLKRFLEELGSSITRK